MALLTNVAGTYQNTQKVFANASGGWKDVQQVFTRVNGQWLPVWSNSAFLRLAPMPTTRTRCVVGAMYGYIYVIGGQTPGQPDTYPIPTERYDPNTNTWTSMGPMPVGQIGNNAPGYRPIKIDSSITIWSGYFVILGGLWSDGVMYNPATNRYNVFIPPYQAQRPILGTMEDYIHMAGGADQYTNYKRHVKISLRNTGKYMDTTSQYYELWEFTSPSTGVAQLPVARALVGYTTITLSGGIPVLVSVGGRSGDQSYPPAQVDNLIYLYYERNAGWGADTWRQISGYRNPPATSSVCWGYGKYLYVMTSDGIVDRFNGDNSIWEYEVKKGKPEDFVTDTNAMVIGSKAYFAGGSRPNEYMTNKLTVLEMN